MSFHLRQQKNDRNESIVLEDRKLLNPEYLLFLVSSCITILLIGEDLVQSAEMEDHRGEA